MTTHRRAGHRAAGLLSLLLISAACTARVVAEPQTKPVPPGLDTASTARWIDAERQACRGVFVTLIDEGANAPSTGPDSTPLYRYVRHVTGVRCMPRA
jgi:hypothetical protein